MTEQEKTRIEAMALEVNANLLTLKDYEDGEMSGQELVFEMFTRSITNHKSYGTPEPRVAYLSGYLLRFTTNYQGQVREAFTQP